MRKAGFMALALSVATVTLSASAAQATIIDNGQFGTNIGTIGGSIGSDVYAQSFTAPADNLLVRFGMWLQGGGADAPLASIDLWADDGAGHADENNILISGTVHQGNLASLTRVDTVTSYLLTPGTQYWVVINGLEDLTSSGTYWSTYDVETGTVAGGHMEWSNDLGLTWTALGGDWGVYVETTSVSPIPEPAALTLFGLGLAGLGFLRRKKTA